MKLDLVKIKIRSQELNELRSGVSLIYGQPIDENMLDTVFRVKSIFKEKYNHIFSWIPINHLHITLLRGKSIKGDFHKAIEIPKYFNFELSNAQQIELTINGIHICNDGAIRIYFDHANFLPNIDTSFLERISNDFGVFVRKPNSLWLTVANIKYPYFLRVVHLYNKESFKHNQLPSVISNKSFVIEETKLVLFRDIAFNHTETLCVYRLKGN